jgi:hypothetical protein
MSSREWLTAIGLGVIVSVLIRVYFPVGLAGPLVWGGFAGVRRMGSLWPVVVSVVAGLGTVLVDLVVKPEHIGFHLALTFTMCALAWSAWSIAGRLTREDHLRQP